MRHLKTLLTVLGAVTVLVLAGNTVALATTGHAFILGKSNRAKGLTTLTRTTTGPAFKVGTKSSNNPPFSVNGKGKVANLNADKLDGFDSSALMGVRAKVYRYVFSTTALSHSQKLPTLPPGVYLVSLNVPMLGATGTAAAPKGYYCELTQSSGAPSGSVQRALVQGDSSNLYDPVVNSTDVITTTQGNQLTLFCSAENAWITTNSYPAEVTVTKLDGATFGTPITSARIATGARTAVK